MSTLSLSLVPPVFSLSFGENQCAQIDFSFLNGISIVVDLKGSFIFLFVLFFFFVKVWIKDVLLISFLKRHNFWCLCKSWFIQWWWWSATLFLPFFDFSYPFHHKPNPLSKSRHVDSMGWLERSKVSEDASQEGSNYQLKPDTRMFFFLFFILAFQLYFGCLCTSWRVPVSIG